MERESFESEEVAKIMNDNFVNIKVDREERPDIDKVYMTFVQVSVQVSNVTISGHIYLGHNRRGRLASLSLVDTFSPPCVWWNLFSSRRQLW